MTPNSFFNRFKIAYDKENSGFNIPVLKIKQCNMETG